MSAMFDVASNMQRMHVEQVYAVVHGDWGERGSNRFTLGWRCFLLLREGATKWDTRSCTITLASFIFDIDVAGLIM